MSNNMIMTYIVLLGCITGILLSHRFNLDSAFVFDIKTGIVTILLDGFEILLKLLCIENSKLILGSIVTCRLLVEIYLRVKICAYNNGFCRKKSIFRIFQFQRSGCNFAYDKRSCHPTNSMVDLVISLIINYKIHIEKDHHLFKICE